MLPYKVECDTLETLFNTLPSSIPIDPPNSSLSPQINAVFASEEGPWPAFNKAMHSSWGNKYKGLKVTECGDALRSTIATICWVLKEIEAGKDTGSAELVKLWIDALVDAAKAAGAATGQYLTI